METIKFIVFTMMACLTLIGTPSCKDDCTDVACANGGNCINGGCDCPSGFEGLNCEDFDHEQIQNHLDNGKSPKELVDGNIPLDSLYGKFYKGGIIFYLNRSDGKGLVSSTEDQSADAQWGCLDTVFAGANGEAIGTGFDNTQAIIGSCPESAIAAKICTELNLNGYTDWFLPSRKELRLMWTNLADSDRNDLNTGPDDIGNLGGFWNTLYWCSTEMGFHRAHSKHFRNGTESNTTTKDKFCHVRAIRAF